MIDRGLVVPLSAAQVVRRARYLAGITGATIDTLDDHVRKDGALAECPTIFYRLKYPNGGTDPTASDPAARWRKPGKQLENVTADCVAGAAWCGGWDRKQPDRFAHLYDGSINTDSMILDVKAGDGIGRCFEALARPEPGCMVVFSSGSGGHAVGHVGTIIGVPLEWDPKERECWRLLDVVDIAGRIGRANRRTTGLAWFDQNTWFLRSTMR